MEVPHLCLTPSIVSIGYIINIATIYNGGWKSTSCHVHPAVREGQWAWRSSKLGKELQGRKKNQQKIKLSKGVSLLQVKCLSCLHSEHILVLKEQSQHPKWQSFLNLRLHVFCCWLNSSKEEIVKSEFSFGWTVPQSHSNIISWLQARNKKKGFCPHIDHVLLIQLKAAFNFLFLKHTLKKLFTHHTIGRCFAINIALKHRSKKDDWMDL